MDLDETLTIRDGSGANSVVLEALVNGGRVQINADPAGRAAELLVALNSSVFTIGAAGFDGQVRLMRASGAPSIILNGRDGDIVLNDDNGEQAIRLTGPLGDVILRGADAAEDFEIVEPDIDAPAGTVMVIDESGRLRESTVAYDRRVAGVISGAGAYRPGIILGRTPGRQGHRPVALVGRTYCRVDATAAPIAIGDLLTTAPSRGHAMRADDAERSHGAVIGKALCAVGSGFDEIPILVALQ